jgi:arylsulfatase A-like enzyme
MNFVVIVSDTFRRDHLGAYGNEWIHTPHLDRFAREAVVFDRHLVGSFPTMPARADLMTGRLSCAFMTWAPLPPALPTLAEAFKAAGYLTTAIVDTPFYIRNGFGYDRGFHDFLWIRGQGDGSRMEERVDARATWIGEADRFVARTMTAASEWLERHSEEQFLLVVDAWDPHEPWNPPHYYTRRYLADYAGEEVQPPYAEWRQFGLTQRDLDVAHATYCGEVTMVDSWVGRLLEKIELVGLKDDTIVVFLSDHGYYFGEHDYLGKSVWVEEARTQTWSPLYSEVTRVPLMVRVPGVAAGRRQALTSLPDVAPTLLELAGLDPVDGATGTSFAGVLSGTAPDEHRPFAISSWPLGYQRGRISIAVDSSPRRVARDLPLTVTTATHSLLVGGPDDPIELYDLALDPGEQRSITADEPALAAQLLEEAIDVLRDEGAEPDLLAPRVDALAMLRSERTTRR